MVSVFETTVVSPPVQTNTVVEEKTRSQALLADADEIEAALVLITRSSAQWYLHSLIAQLRKEGKAVQSTLAAIGSSNDSGAAATSLVNADRAATPPKEITHVTKPTIASPENKNQTIHARYESQTDYYATLIYQESQHRKREAEGAVAAAAKAKENAMIAPESENEGQGTQDKAGKQSLFIIDLSDVPPQPPIPKRAGFIKGGDSKYTGVTFDERKKKWIARIGIDGKLRYIGIYKNEEEAAVDYARAAFKFRRSEKKKTQNALETSKRKRPPCAEEEENTSKFDASKGRKRPKKAERERIWRCKLAFLRRFGKELLEKQSRDGECSHSSVFSSSAKSYTEMHKYVWGCLTEEERNEFIEFEKPQAFRMFVNNTKFLFSPTNKMRESNLVKKRWLYDELLNLGFTFLPSSYLLGQENGQRTAMKEAIKTSHVEI